MTIQYTRPSFFKKKIYQKLQLFVEEVVGLICEKYGPALRAIVIFGSFARGEVTLGSDLDVLIILKKTALRFRERLSDFDKDISTCVDGEFSLPLSPIIMTENEVFEFNPLLLEIFESHWIIYDDGIFKKVMNWIGKLIEDGIVQKQITNGQTSWRITHEEEIDRRLPGAI
jgi:predicted nucleotidyltransferase